MAMLMAVYKMPALITAIFLGSINLRFSATRAVGYAATCPIKRRNRGKSLTGSWKSAPPQ